MGCHSIQTVRTDRAPLLRRASARPAAQLHSAVGQAVRQPVSPSFLHSGSASRALALASSCGSGSAGQQGSSECLASPRASTCQPQGPNPTLTSHPEGLHTCTKEPSPQALVLLLHPHQLQPPPSAHSAPPRRPTYLHKGAVAKALVLLLHAGEHSIQSILGCTALLQVLLGGAAE